MNKSILIINSSIETAQTIKHHLTSPNTEIVCVSSMAEALVQQIEIYSAGSNAPPLP